MKKIVISLILAIALTTTLLSAVAVEYTDTKDHWAEKEILANTFTEIFKEGGVFLPNKAITRIEFVQILHKALGIQIMYFRAPDIQEFFSDVKNEEPGASALYDLVISNIIPKSDTFRSNEPLRRDEMIHYLINGLKHKTNGEYALIKMMPPPFTDDAKIAPAYKNDVVEAVLLKIINGRGDNMLFPEVPATRAESVVAITRLMNLLKNLADVNVTPEATITGDRLEMKLFITNNTDKAIEIQHTSGQRFDFKLLDAKGEILYTWSADKLFIMALTTTTIEAGETLEFKDVLDGESFTSLKDQVHSMKAYIVGTSEGFNINTDGYEYNIEK